jgi:hypothetical protein
MGARLDEGPAAKARHPRSSGFRPGHLAANPNARFIER